MSTTHDTTTRGNILSQIIPGITPAALDVYSASNVLLASFTSPAYANSGVSASLSNGPISATGLANGTASYARLRNAGSTRWEQYNDLRATSGGDLQFDSLTIVQGQPCSLVSHTISAPL